MKTTLILLVALTHVFAAPRKPLITYDQRQTGELNVHGKLDNFLFVLAPPMNLNLASAATPIAALIQQQQQLSSRVASHPEESHNFDNDPEAQISFNSEIKKIEDDNSSVKIVATIKEDHPIESVEAVSQSGSSAANLQENKKTEEVNEKPAKALIHPKSARCVKHHSSEISSDEKLPSPNSGLESSENKLTEPSNDGKNQGNDVGVETELKLIGDGIENCGPDRYRNQAGICEFRRNP